MFAPRDTECVNKLLETVAAELERPRVLSPKVITYIAGGYHIDRDDVPVFLEKRLPELEDYEVDLILSPLFTPRLADQATFAAILRTDAVTQSQRQELVRQIAARPTIAHLITPDSSSTPVPLREVTIERYVHRLRLDGAIPPSIARLVERTGVPGDQSLLLAIARRAIWETESRREILSLYLAGAGNSYRLADAVDLLNLVESYQPADLGNLMKRIPSWKSALKEEIQQGPRAAPFFSAGVQDAHGGERDQRQQDVDRLQAKENELAFLERLERILDGTINGLV